MLLGSGSKNKIRLVASLAIGILLLAALIWWIGIDEIVTAISSASPIWLIASALTILPAYGLRAIRWKLLLAPVKKDVRVSSTFWSTSLGFMVNTLIPIRFGEVVRAYVLGEKEGTGFAPGLSSIVVERTLDLIGLLGIGIVTMFLVSAQAELSSIVVSTFTAVAVLIVAILALIMLGVKKEALVIRVVTGVASKIPFVKRYTLRIADFAGSLIKGLKGLSQNPKMFVANISLTLFLWLTQTVAIYWVFTAFNYPMPFVAAILGGVLMSLSNIVPATPGYVGSYEAFWMIIFFSLGVTQADLLLAMGVVSHLISVLPTIIVGCVSVVWLGASFEDIFTFKKYVAAVKPLH
jgi:glycosyltransferase 2 family protein